MPAPTDRHLSARAFMENPLVVIAATGHPLVHKKNIPLNRLLDDPLIVREPGSGTRSAVEKTFSDHELPFQIAMEMNKNEAIKHAVEAGLGIGVVSLHTIRAEIASGQLAVLDVKGFPLKRLWYLVQREHKRLSPAATAFTEMVLHEAPGYEGEM